MNSTTEQKKQRTSDVISEKPRLIRFGFLFFLMRPLTLSQIWETGRVLEKMNLKDVIDRDNMVALILGQPDNVKLSAEVITHMMFRSLPMRKLFGWYVKKNLTMKLYRKALEYYLVSLHPAFFLISFTSLKGVKEVTKLTNTQSGRAHV